MIFIDIWMDDVVWEQLCPGAQRIHLNTPSCRRKKDPELIKLLWRMYDAKLVS
jgi:hypothetical protein